MSDWVALFDGKESSNVYAIPNTSIGGILVSTLLLKFIKFKKVLLKTVLHVFLLKSKLLFLVSKNSELKAKFLFKNKATKSSKNVPSLGSNVDWVCLGCDVVVGDCIGGNFVPDEKVVVEVAVVGNVTV